MWRKVRITVLAAAVPLLLAFWAGSGTVRSEAWDRGFGLVFGAATALMCLLLVGLIWWRLVIVWGGDQ